MPKFLNPQNCALTQKIISYMNPLKGVENNFIIDDILSQLIFSKLSHISQLPNYIYFLQFFIRLIFLVRIIAAHTELSQQYQR